MRGESVTIPLYQVLDFWLPNDMGFFAKLGHYFVQLGKFISDDPREANTEGGVFPAIFGTVFNGNANGGDCDSIWCCCCNLLT